MKQTAAMDWHSWLSKTNLEPSLVYEYGLAFARNELEQEDVPYFNHEFLQSMGISVAKHRLEILKLATKESKGVMTGNISISNLVLKFHKAKRRIAKRLSKWIFHGDSTVKAIQEPSLHQEQMKGSELRRYTSEKTMVMQQKHMRPTLSGPLDVRMQEKLGVPQRSLKLSGPLDNRLYVNRSPRLNGRVQERAMFANRSPRLSGQLDNRVQERLMITNKSPRLSGPIDGKMQERLMYKSPRVSGPLDGRVVSPMIYSQQNKGRVDDGAYDDEEDEYDHLIWTALFQDMKPT